MSQSNYHKLDYFPVGPCSYDQPLSDCCRIIKIEVFINLQYIADISSVFQRKILVFLVSFL